MPPTLPPPGVWIVDLHGAGRLGVVLHATPGGVHVRWQTPPRRIGIIPPADIRPYDLPVAATVAPSGYVTAPSPLDLIRYGNTYRFDGWGRMLARTAGLQLPAIIGGTTERNPT